jgi:hypothetical protein
MPANTVTQLFPRQDIAERDPAAGFQEAPDLFEDEVFVGVRDEVDDAVAGDAVGYGVWEHRDGRDGGFDEGDVLGVRGFEGVAVREGEHVLGEREFIVSWWLVVWEGRRRERYFVHINTYCHSVRRDFFCGEENIQSGAATKINDRLALNSSSIIIQLVHYPFLR